MKLLKLNIIFFIVFLALSTPGLAVDLKSPPDSLHNESFILLPGYNSSDTSKLLTSNASASPFPAFFLIDTTVSTLIVDEGLSIQVELHKVDFLANTNRKDSSKRLIKGDLALMPRKKPTVLPSKAIHVKIAF